MPAVSFVAVNQSTETPPNASTSRSVVIPASAQEGDLLVATLVGLSAQTWSAPAGWRTDFSESASFAFYTWTKFATASDPGTTVTFTAASTSQACTAGIAAYRYVSRRDVYVQDSGLNVSTSSNTGVSAPSKPGAADGKYVGVYGMTVGGADFTAVPSGFTSRLDRSSYAVFQSGFWVALLMADKNLTDNSATGTATPTGTSNSKCAGGILVLRPAVSQVCAA